MLRLIKRLLSRLTVFFLKQQFSDLNTDTQQPILSHLFLWEAQFGDFVNAAQVMIDNFISSSYTKWGLPNNLVMLLPHAQEGQGPEHSSARLERFLILCADDNMIVCNPTNSEQYFHLLRRQSKQSKKRPLVIMTPKSLLRLPEAKSRKIDFTKGEFNEIIDDTVSDKSKIKRVIVTSGKVYYDLMKYKNENKISGTAIVRLEQYYPYESKEMKEDTEFILKMQKMLYGFRKSRETWEHGIFLPYF